MDMESGYIPLNRSFGNGGHKPIKLSKEEEAIEANWGTDFHVVLTAVKEWATRIAQKNDGFLDTKMRDRLIDKAIAMFRAHSDDDTDSKLSPGFVSVCSNAF